jgi:hypothetical protein
LILAAGSVSPAAEKRVCALIDTTNLPAAGVLEAKLLADEAGTWVERSAIDRLLAERDLQAAFTAEGVSNRSSIGALLKADVLVLLRIVKGISSTAPDSLDCVVCETRRGLRLQIKTISVDRGDDEIVAALESTVQDGLKKYSERIETVVAVPPFLSEDLGLERNYLQTAYAKLVEQSLLAQPGLLVVELGEAQAIAKEVLLGTENVNRSQPPFYILGRYRHDVADDVTTMRMSLRLMHGDEELTLKGTRGMAPEEATTWIHKKTDELVKSLAAGEKPTAEFKPEVEARRLAARGRDFQKVGSWPEALALYEASLLLAPNQDDIRQAAVRCTSPQFRPLLPLHTDLERAKRGLALYERGLEHLEAFLRTAKDMSSYRGEREGIDFAMELECSLMFALLPQRDTPPEVEVLLAEVRERRRATLLRIARFRMLAGFADSGDRWDVLALNWLPEKERFALILGLCDSWHDVPNLTSRIHEMSFGGGSPKDTPELQAFLRDLSNSQHEPVRKAAVAIRATAERNWKKQEEIAARKAPAEPDQIDPRLKVVQFQAPPKTHNFETVTITPACDLYWDHERFLTMHKPGILEFNYDPPLNPHLMSRICFDGRYVWLATKTHNGPPTIIAFDPSTQKSWTFGEAEGLPQGDQRTTELRLAPVGIGKAVVVGNTGRTWAAIAEIVGEGTRFKVFFEARETINGNDVSQAGNVRIGFSPGFAIPLWNPQRTQCRVIVGRNSHAACIRDVPLVLDPQRKTVEVATFKMPGDIDKKTYVYDNEALYLFQPIYPNPPRMVRIDFPAKEAKVLIDPTPEGWMALDDLGLHIIGREWWLADPRTGDTQSLVKDVAWFYANNYNHKLGENMLFGVDLNNTSMISGVSSTSHYGPLITVKKGIKEKYLRLDLNASAP